MVMSLMFRMVLLMAEWCFWVLQQQGSLADAMMDSMMDGQSATVELAKELVVEVLQDPDTPLALKSLLDAPELRWVGG